MFKGGRGIPLTLIQKVRKEQGSTASK